MPYGLPSPPPPQQLPISPQAGQIQAGVEQQVGLPPPPPPPGLQPPPEQRPSALRSAAPFLPAALGLGLGLFGKGGTSDFGAGMAMGSSNQLLGQARERRQQEGEQEQHRMKNVGARVEKARRLASTNPAFAQVANAYDAALLDGKFDAKEAGKIAEMLDGLPDVEGLLAQADSKREIDQYTAQQQAKSDIERKLAKLNNVDVTTGGGQSLNVPPEQALNYYSQQDKLKAEEPRRALQDKLTTAQIQNIGADNARADAMTKLQTGARGQQDDAAYETAANALATGQARTLSEAMAMIGSARQRGDAGVKIMAKMGDRIALPPAARTRIGEINSSIDTLAQVRTLIDQVVNASPADRIQNSYLLDSFVHSNAAALAGAMGEKGVKTEPDIKRALGLVPGWFSTNVAPSIAYKKLDMAKDRFERNKAAVVSPYLGSIHQSGATPGMPEGLSSPPLPPAAQRKVGQSYVMKDGKSAVWNGHGFD